MPRNLTSAPAEWVGKTAFAAAKVNLTLAIEGRLPNGYHALTSLVAFADIGDVITVVAADEVPADGATRVLSNDLDQHVTIDDNLIDTARRKLAEIAPALVLPPVRLAKYLPIAAGLGGGSADVAAYLRLVKLLNDPRVSADINWAELALSLGADVPVCLCAAPTLMEGIGERLTPVPLDDRLHAVIVNPRAPVPATKTRDVFTALAAAPIADVPTAMPRETIATPDEVMRLVREGRNDLTNAAISVVPQIADVLEVIGATDEVDVVRLSGAGPSAFGLYHAAAAAARAAHSILGLRPDWWVECTTLGGGLAPRSA